MLFYSIENEHDNRKRKNKLTFHQERLPLLLTITIPSFNN